MSTRGAYGFRLEGKDKVAYNHSDSYPSWLGVRVLGFVADTPDEELLRIAKRIQLVGIEPPTTKQIEHCKSQATVNLGVSLHSTGDWYCLLRGSQGDLSVYKDGGLLYMDDSACFLADSLFCEWAYIINLDTDELEVYRGFNKNPVAGGRYSALSHGDHLPDNGYVGVRLVKTVPFDQVRAARQVSGDRGLRDMASLWEREVDAELELEDGMEMHI